MFIGIAKTDFGKVIESKIGFFYKKVNSIQINKIVLYYKIVRNHPHFETININHKKGSTIMNHEIVAICVNKYLQEYYNKHDKVFVNRFNVVQIIPPDMIDGKKPREQWEACFEGGKATLIVPGQKLNEFFVKVVG